LLTSVVLVKCVSLSKGYALNTERSSKWTNKQMNKRNVERTNERMNEGMKERRK